MTMRKAPVDSCKFQGNYPRCDGRCPVIPPRTNVQGLCRAARTKFLMDSVGVGTAGLAPAPNTPPTSTAVRVPTATEQLKHTVYVMYALRSKGSAIYPELRLTACCAPALAGGRLGIRCGNMQSYAHKSKPYTKAPTPCSESLSTTRSQPFHHVTAVLHASHAHHAMS